MSLLAGLLFLSLGPGAVSPRSYSASLNLNPANPSFEGSVQIELTLGAAQKAIRLNARDLTLHNATVRFQNVTYPAKTTLTENEFLTLELPHPVGPGPATVTIGYTGKLPETATEGAFRTRFEDRWYLFTTFTAIDARRAFPCFDEPRFKTPWTFTLRIPQGDSAFSNAAQLTDTPNSDGTHTVRFAPTAPIPSGVAAFAVGPFDVLAGGQAGEKHFPVRVIAPAGHANEGGEAMKMTPGIVAALERYTGIPYPWSKLDHVALPRGTFGGVEQPGLITYRMRGLLSPPEPERLRSLLTHELAHQWFGNLVTQSSWKDVWLSEGFATWLTFHINDPEHTAAIAARERIMTADNGPKTRPVRTELHNRDEMKDVYSQFVYQKAGAILLMLEGWLGAERFQTILRSYLQAHRNGTAAIDDLGDLFNASPVLHNFLDRTGVPVVRAEKSCAEKPLLALTVSAGPIPVCWKADGVARRCEVLATGTHRENLDRCPAWVYPNAGGTGYYRSEFEAAPVLANLASFTPAEKLTIQNDMAAREKK